ncbi:MAG: hypothetical protein U0802_18605 [Candidatus Binatia bacterium]
MIAAADPQVVEAKRHVPQPHDQRARRPARLALVPPLVGGEKAEWKALALGGGGAHLCRTSSCIQTMWRQAPITAAIVIATGFPHESKITGVEHGLHKVAEVIFAPLAMGLDGELAHGDALAGARHQGVGGESPGLASRRSAALPWNGGAADAIRGAARRHGSGRSPGRQRPWRGTAAVPSVVAGVCRG